MSSYRKQNSKTSNLTVALSNLMTKLGLGMRGKLILLFIIIKVVPLIFLALVAWNQSSNLGDELIDRTNEITKSALEALYETGEIAIQDSVVALDNRATEEIERMSTDTARQLASFLYLRDSDILFAASLPVSEEIYKNYIKNYVGQLVKPGEWGLSEDESQWVRKDPPEALRIISSSIPENENRFNYRQPVQFEYQNRPLYHEITFIDLEGQEKVKLTTSDLLSPALKDVSKKENTFIKAEKYFDELKDMQPGEIYVSDVIGEYVGSKIIGRYIPENAKKRDIPFEPENSAYANQENPVGKKFRGIVRWASPVEKDGKKIGYVTLALDHDHIMEFVDHLKPTVERYTEISDAFEGNYAFIWDYKGRSIVHPRHFSIPGYDAETGDPQVPWLEGSIYDEWQKSEKTYAEFIEDVPTFFEQSNSKKPAAKLTKDGYVGLDCRYLNFAAQCTGWFDLTKDGGSGSFNILWSGLWKLNTAAAIPYYTGRYGESKRGFGFVAIGAEVADFHAPAMESKKELDGLMGNSKDELNKLAERTHKAIKHNLFETALSLSVSTALMAALVVFVAIWMASVFTRRITYIITGITRFREGERDFRFNAAIKDEMGDLSDAFDDMADSLVEAESDPLVITDLNRKVIYYNEPAAKAANINLEEGRGKDYFDISIYPTGSSQCPITALLENREANVVFLPKMKSYFRGDASYLLNDKGERIGYIITSRDVTNIIQNSKRIEAQKTLLDTVVNFSPDLIWYKDSDNRFVMVNPRFSSLLNAMPQEFIGKTAKELLPESVLSSFGIPNVSLETQGKAVYSEGSILFADGHEEILDVVQTPIFNKDGSYHGILGVARDVSQRVYVEEALRKTQKDLEQVALEARSASASKSIFLARMSHEIRTPMNAILGMAHIVSKKLKKNSPVLDDVKSNVKQIELSSQHLLGLINDILDISKIEAGKIELNFETFDLEHLILNVSTIITPRCNEKDLEYELEVPDDLPAYLKTDTLRLRQVLINLLDNAVKFTPADGRVNFTVKCLSEDEYEAKVLFEVRDTGIGISSKEQEHLFSPFEQASELISGQFGGTGLGLSISKSIVEMLGGSLGVDSLPGQGSIFSFALIFEKAAEEEEKLELKHEEIELDCRGKVALIVDDVEINRVILREQLRDSGIKIEEASDGEEAVRKVEDSPEDYYDIVFMDIQMPKMDGYRASRAIRILERQDVIDLPVVAMTANAFKEDIEKALAAGMNEHLAKPLDHAKLTEVMYRFVVAGKKSKRKE